MTTHSEFGANTTATEVAQAFAQEIRGKTIVITGISPSSIGSSTALSLASQLPSTLILASRTPSKLALVASQISKTYPLINILKIPLDLASIESIRSAAADINDGVDHIDILINNAGVSLTYRDPITTPDGSIIDAQFFINHLGPFLLTSLLLPKLLLAAAANHSPKSSTRVINLSSHGHRLSPVRFSDFQFSLPIYDGVPESERPPLKIASGFLQTSHDGYPGFLGYGQSKSANILHALELSLRFRTRGLMGLSVHPGSIKTDLSRALDEQGRKMIDGTAPGGGWKSLDQGATTTLVAALDPGLGGLDVGKAGGGCGYLADCQLAEGMAAEWVRDPSVAGRLWGESERMLGITDGLR